MVLVEELKLKKPKTKVGTIQHEGETIYFKVPERECYFIDIRDIKKREKFAYSIAETEMCGLCNEGDKETWEDAMEWIIDSELPIIVYKKDFFISRVQEIKANTNNIEVMKIHYSEPREVKYRAKRYSLMQTKVIRRFRDDLKAYGMRFSDEEYEEIENAYGSELYYAYLKGESRLIEPIIANVKKYYYTGDKIFECLIADMVSDRKRMYQIRDREIHNLMIMSGKGDKLREKYYTIRPQVLDKIRETVNSDIAKSMDSSHVIGEHADAHKNLFSFKYAYEFGFENEQREIPISNETILSKAKHTDKKEIYAIDLGCSKGKTNSLDVNNLIMIHEQIEKLVYDDLGVKMPIKLRRTKELKSV